MRTVILRRALHSVLMIFGVITLTFVLGQLVPGDFTNTLAADPLVSPEMIESMRHRFGMDRPWWIQYVLYLKSVLLHLDFGESFSRRQPVFTVIQEGLLNTLLLQATAALFAWGLAIPFGVWAAVRQYSPVDKALSLVANIGLAIPQVLSGLLLLLFAAHTRLFPLGGMRSIDWESLDPGRRVLDVLWHLVLPALAVGLTPLAGNIRQVRGNLLDVLRLDYVRTARAKGMGERTVHLKHALPNALNPLISLFGLTLGTLISGSFIVEVIFSWPGLGRITFEALFSQDQYLALGGVIMASVMLVMGNLIADLLLAGIDPRISDS